MKLKVFLQICVCAICLSFHVSAQVAAPTFEQGLESFRKGDYATAIKVLKTVVKSGGSAEAWFYLGNAYAQQNDLKNAQKALEKAVSSDAANARAHAGLAYLYLRKDDEEKASASVRKALEVDKNNFEAHYVRGVLSYRDGSFNSAYQSADKAITGNPRFAPAYLLKSEALAQSFGILLGAVSKSPTERGELLTDAAANLETYLKLTPGASDVAEQRERLEGLRYLAQYYLDKAKQPAESPDAANNVGRLKILSKAAPSYTDAARRANVSGTVRLSVLFAADGKVRYVLILNKLPGGLTEKALAAARNIKFEPETKDGKPISVVKTIEYNFSLY